MKQDISTFDLLVLDLEMPGIDGFGVLEWLKTNQRVNKPPVVIASAKKTSPAILEKLKNSGVKGFIIKDSLSEELTFIVNNTLYPDNKYRKNTRVPVNIRINYTRMGFSRSAIAVNLSESGIFIKTSEALQAGDCIELNFFLPQNHDNIHVDAEVRSIAKYPHEKKSKYGIGLEFKDILPEEKTLIASFVQGVLNRLF